MKGERLDSPEVSENFECYRYAKKITLKWIMKKHGI